MTTNDDEIFKDDGTFIEKFECKCGNRDNWDDYYLCTECQSPAKFVQYGRKAEQRRIWEHVVLRDTVINGWEHPLDLNKDTILLRDLKRIIFGKGGE